MGLIGPGDNWITGIFEYLFGRIVIICLHDIYHDVSGRFYARYRKGNGYIYAFNLKCHLFKRSPLLGHITGIFRMHRKRQEIEETLSQGKFHQMIL